VVAACSFAPALAACGLLSELVLYGVTTAHYCGISPRVHFELRTGSGMTGLEHKSKPIQIHDQLDFVELTSSTPTVIKMRRTR